MTPFVIGLAGAAGAGKSTVALRLKSEWGAHRVPFAGALKEMLQVLLERQGCGLATAIRMVAGDLKEVPTDLLGGASPRHAMQTLGTEWGRALAPDFWVGVWRRSIERTALEASADGETILVVADDVRFPEEAAAIRALGGLVVRIDRPGAGLAGAAGAHPSETTDIGNPDQVIVNDRDLVALIAAADDLASNVMA